VLDLRVQALTDGLVQEQFVGVEARGVAVVEDGRVAKRLGLDVVGLLGVEDVEEAIRHVPGLVEVVADLGARLVALFHRHLQKGRAPGVELPRGDGGLDELQLLAGELGLHGHVLLVAGLVGRGRKQDATGRPAGVQRMAKAGLLQLLAGSEPFRDERHLDHLWIRWEGAV
jgi:hypothetical protein